MTDIIWCVSPTCTTKCDIHISNFDPKTDKLNKTADFSETCWDYDSESVCGADMREAEVEE